MEYSETMFNFPDGIGYEVDLVNSQKFAQKEPAIQARRLYSGVFQHRGCFDYNIFNSHLTTCRPLCRL